MGQTRQGFGPMPVGTEIPGQVFAIAAEPIDEACTTWFRADTLRIGLEYRRLTAESLQATYGDAPEVTEAIAAPSFEPSEGWSVHVTGRNDGHEYLRFDCFDNDPHYHYLHRTAPGEPVVNHRIPYDPEADGPMGNWVLRCLRSRLPEMLTEARGANLAGCLDHVAIERAIQAIKARLREIN